MDYGSVSCSVAAEMTEGSGGDGVGPGRPCVYHIVPAGKVMTISFCFCLHFMQPIGTTSQ